MKKIILPVLLVLSVVLIAGFFVLTPSYIQDNGDVKHFEDSDMSFDLSKSWTVYEYDDPLKTPFLSSSPSSLLLNPGNSSQYSYYDGNVEDLTANGTVLNTSATNATDVVIVKTEITKMDSLPNGVTIDEAYKSDSLYAIMDGTGDFQLLNQSTFDLNGQTAHQFVYTVTYTKYQDTWFEVNGHYYRVLNQAPTSVYDNAEGQFNTTLSTLNFK
ncbi:hypothetical protein [Methanosphaera sp.]